MSGNRAMKRALSVNAVRVNSGVPLIVDTTELVTPEIAENMLKNNRCNRPVNWRKVEEFSRIMQVSGAWKLHSQGIILDQGGNIITGQTRLWAVIYSGCSVYFRISRGNNPDVAKVIDRGRPQSARDLATRDTQKKHSPTEVSIARAICAINGNLKPSTDIIGTTIVRNSEIVSMLLSETLGMKKTKAVIMILASIVVVSKSTRVASELVKFADEAATKLLNQLSPQSPESCWGKGAAFSLALEIATRIIKELQ